MQFNVAPENTKNGNGENYKKCLLIFRPFGTSEYLNILMTMVVFRSQVMQEIIEKTLPYLFWIFSAIWKSCAKCYQSIFASNTYLLSGCSGMCVILLCVCEKLVIKTWPWLLCLTATLQTTHKLCRMSLFYCCSIILRVFIIVVLWWPQFEAWTMNTVNFALISNVMCLLAHKVSVKLLTLLSENYDASIVTSNLRLH